MMKAQFIKFMCDRHPGMYKEDVRKIVDVVFEGVKAAIATGDNFYLPGVGIFYPFYKRYEGGKCQWKSPGTGEVYEIKDKVQLKFRASRSFERFLSEKLIHSNTEAESG
jgi:nucleoid DNA-binding protein